MLCMTRLVPERKNRRVEQWGEWRDKLESCGRRMGGEERTEEKKTCFSAAIEKPSWFICERVERRGVRGVE